MPFLKANNNIFMCLFDLPSQVSMGSSVNDKKSYVITGHWDPSDPVFCVLNQETPRDGRDFMTVAIHLVIRKLSQIFLLSSRNIECLLRTKN